MVPVDMEDSSWYDGAQTTYLYWPLNKFNWKDNPLITTHVDNQAVSINKN